jgi:2-polyprenyl-6-methoxyphenol hydroxylase-like FAD-dependent oxidoreductase
LNLGLADAHALATTLAQREGKDYWRSVGDPYLLRQYERARKAGLWPTWLACDGLQRLFSHSQPLAQSFRNWGMSSFNQFAFLKQWTVHQAMNPSF